MLFVVNGERHMANVSDPQIPSALAPVVVGLSNMNNFFPKTEPRKSQPVTYNKACKEVRACPYPQVQLL